MKRTLIAALILMLPASAAVAQNGEPDPGFGTGGFGPGRVVVAFNQGGDNTDVPGAVAVDEQGRVVVVGTLATNTNSIIGIARLLANGEPDVSFSSDGKATLIFAAANVEAFAVAIQPDGKVLVAGETAFGPSFDSDFVIVRLLANGSVDTSFGVSGSRRIAFDEPGAIRDSARAITLGANGRILVAGVVVADTMAVTRMAVARLTVDGNLDTTFDGDGRKSFAFSASPALDFVTAVAEMPDGRIVLAGGSSSSGTADFALVRLLENGDFDPAFGNVAAGRSRAAFDLGGNNFDRANSLAISTTGWIYLAGMASLGTSAQFGIAKFDASGFLDSGFAGGGRQTVDFAVAGAAIAIAYGVAVQENGAIVVAGAATHTTTGIDFASARLSATGVLDTSFGVGGRQLLGFDLGADNNDNGIAMVLANGRMVSVGSVQRVFGAGADRDFGILAQTVEREEMVFADGFE